MSHVKHYLQFFEAARPSFIKPVPKKEKADDEYKKIYNMLQKSKSEVEYDETGLVTLKYNQLEAYLNDLDNMPTSRGMGYSSIIYGEAGIGKSAVMANRAKKRAQELNREFISLDSLINKYRTAEELKLALKRYFIFIDERAAGFDPGMMTGIPDPTSPEKRGYLTELPVPWVSIMTMSEDAAGFLFLDEINQADESQQNMLFSLLNYEERRIAGKYKILGDWRIHSAGNIGEGYRASIVDLVSALKERLAPALLTIDFEGWISWADTAKLPVSKDKPLIHPILRDFIEDDIDLNFYQSPSESEDVTKRPNPRNHVALSSSMYKIIGNGDTADEDSWRRLITQAATQEGKDFASRFQDFLQANSIVDIEDIFNRPEQLMMKPGDVSRTEDKTTQRMAVFKRKIKYFVIDFANKFESLDSDKKEEMMNTALNYMYVFNSVFEEEPNIAAILFQPIAAKDMRTSFKVFRNTGLSYLLKEQNNKEAAKYFANTFELIGRETHANISAVQKSAASENEEGKLNVSSKVSNFIDDFLNKLASGTLPELI